MKINFIIVGAQKAGTSALDFYLRQHPEIGMAKEKELHFFDNEKIFSNPPVNYSLFENQFERKEGVKVYGEVSPIYMYWPPSMKRIWEYNENMKLIAILRNPIERAFSHWNMDTERKMENQPFAFCIKNEEERIKEPFSKQHRNSSYADRGFYSVQIKRIQRYFPKEQVLFIKYEDFLRHHEQTLCQILNFLEVNVSKFNFEYKEVHKRDYQHSLSSEEKQYLLDLYANDIVEVEKMLSWDCSDWKQ